VHTPLKIVIFDEYVIRCERKLTLWLQAGTSDVTKRSQRKTKAVKHKHSQNVWTPIYITRTLFLNQIFITPRNDDIHCLSTSVFIHEFLFVERVAGHFSFNYKTEEMH